jgi:hypothetical protein
MKNGAQQQILLSQMNSNLNDSRIENQLILEKLDTVINQ